MTDERLAQDSRNSAGMSTLLITSLLIAAVSVTMLATELTIPSNPSLPEFFGVSEAAIMVSMVLNLLGYAVAPPILGSLSDRFGRRPILLICLFVFAAASALAAIAWTVEIFIVARMLQGLAGAAAPVIGMAVVRDLFDEKNSVRVIAVVSMSIALVPALGPAIGGYIHNLAGWQANYAALAVAGLVVVMLLAWRLRETIDHYDHKALTLKRFSAKYGQLLRHRDYICYALLPTCGFAGMSAFVAGGPFYLIDVIGMTEVEYGLIQAALVVCYVIGALTAKVGIERIGFERTHLIGIFLFALGGIGELLLMTQTAPSALMFTIPMAIFICGMGVIFATAPARALTLIPGLTGTASAMLTTLEMLGGATAVVAVSYLYDGTAGAISVVIAISALAAVGVQALLSYGAATRGGSA